MNMKRSSSYCGYSVVLLCIAVNSPVAGAQAVRTFSPMEIAGDWDAPGAGAGQGGGLGSQEDVQDRGAGPDGGDYAGMPLNEAGRFMARGHSPEMLTVPEHQCQLHPVTYQHRGPGGMSIVKTYDPVTEKLVAYKVTGNYSLPRTIWMDGRPHPGPYARHTYEGFSTGKWVDDKLVVETTHIKQSYVRRNGVPNSDQARMLEFFVRHDNYLTLNAVVEDPIYFSEPLFRTTDFKATFRPNSQLIEAFGGTQDGGPGGTYYKCTGIDEVDAPVGRIPHYLPGKETDEVETYSRLYDIPLQAAFGGPETMYPEFQQRLGQLGGYKPGLISVVFAEAPRPLAQPVQAKTSPADTSVSSQHVKGKVWAITAGGQNTVVQVGDEGILVVDPGKRELAAAVMAEIRKIAGNKPVRQIVYTSADPLRVSATDVINAPLTPGGQVATVIAHENVGLTMGRAKMSSDLIPTDTFFRGARTIYFNDEPVEVIHVLGAHSSGDAIVFFRESGVVVTGALLPGVTYPEIEVDDGASIQGMVDAMNKLLSITVASWHGQGGTMVVPGQGRIYDEGDVAEYRDMLTIVRDRIADAVAEGKTLEQVKAARLTRDYDARYGVIPGPTSTAAFTEAVYRSLKASPATAQTN
jgi:glyoxylase-like metal-dependent hydrolase (beta-lactamase superfamily II)